MDRTSCFLDHKRPCPPDEGDEYPCRAWSNTHDECVFIAYVRNLSFTDGTVTITTFPKGAPPPEVR